MQKSAGRILAVDVGSKRIGIAVSDEALRFALPRETVPAEAAVDHLCDTARAESVSVFVLGWPLDLDGREGRAVLMVERFRSRLRKALEAAGLEVEIDTWDERLTTSGAERALIGAGMSRRRRKEVVDSVAAAAILEGYLQHLALETKDE